MYINNHKPYGLYEKYFKRPLDLILSSIAFVILLPVLMAVYILVKIKLGSPVIFVQKRPGLNEKVFKLYKFRSMTDEKDDNGNLLPDDVRLTSFGKALRNTSLDELPELINIIKGDMAIIGPRPQLVRDMLFMTNEQRKRHSVRPGLSGLAQVKGRNDLIWEEKLSLDLEYIKHITLVGDIKIILETIIKVITHEGVVEKGKETATDLGDYLLSKGEINKQQYNQLQQLSKEIEDKYE